MTVHKWIQSSLLTDQETKNKQLFQLYVNVFVWVTKFVFFLVFTLLRLWFQLSQFNRQSFNTTQEENYTCGLLLWFLLFFVCCHGDKASQQTSALEMWLCEYLHKGSACETLLIHQQKDFPKGTRTYIWVARTNLKLQHVNVNKASSLKRTAHQESKERQAKNWRW